MTKPHWIEVIILFWSVNKKDIIINAFGAFLGFLGAYILYWIQQRATSVGEKNNTISRYKERINYVSDILNSVSKYARNQAVHLNSFREAVQSDPASAHRILFIANSSIERMVRADSEETYHAYNQLHKLFMPSLPASYRKLLATVDILSARIGQMKFVFQSYLDDTHNRQLLFKSKLEAAANDLAVILDNMRVKPNYVNDPNFIMLNDLMLDYVKLNSQLVSLTKYVEVFVRPLQIVMVKKLRNESYSQKMAIALKDISVIHSDIITDSKASLHFFDSADLIESADNIDAITEELSKLVSFQPKSWYQFWRK